MITEKTLSASENARRAMKENKERQEEFNKYLKGFLRDKKGP